MGVGRPGDQDGPDAAAHGSDGARAAPAEAKAEAEAKAVAVPDFQALFESAPGRYLVLSPELVIVAVSDAYLGATMTRRGDLVGRHILAAFPENPDDAEAHNVEKVGRSLWRALLTRKPDFLPAQKYDIRRPDADGGGFEERYWNLLNAPVLRPDGAVAYVIHQVEDVTVLVNHEREVEFERQANETMRSQLSVMERQVVRALNDASDRERIARDLHDLVIQRVFGAGMRLSSIVGSVPDTAAEKLREVVGELDAVISDIRTTIFDLQSPMLVHRGLRAGVLALASDANERLGFPARVQFEGPVDTVVDRERGDQLLAVLREALSNVIRHAHATSVEVDVCAGPDLLLRVCDDGDGDGDGVDPGDQTTRRPGKGLRNMKARAKGLSGTCTIGRRRPRGTMVEWRVPLGVPAAAPRAPAPTPTPATPPEADAASDPAPAPAG
jgi:signal transduction histidine kinase